MLLFPVLSLFVACLFPVCCFSSYYFLGTLFSVISFACLFFIAVVTVLCHLCCSCAVPFLLHACFLWAVFPLTGCISCYFFGHVHVMPLFLCTFFFIAVVAVLCNLFVHGGLCAIPQDRRLPFAACLPLDPPSSVPLRYFSQCFPCRSSSFPNKQA